MTAYDSREAWKGGRFQGKRCIRRSSFTAQWNSMRWWRLWRPGDMLIACDQIQYRRSTLSGVSARISRMGGSP